MHHEFFSFNEFPLCIGRHVHHWDVIHHMRKLLEGRIQVFKLFFTVNCFFSQELLVGLFEQVRMLSDVLWHVLLGLGDSHLFFRLDDLWGFLRLRVPLSLHRHLRGTVCIDVIAGDNWRFLGFWSSWGYLLWVQVFLCAWGVQKVLVCLEVEFVLLGSEKQGVLSWAVVVSGRGEDSWSIHRDFFPPGLNPSGCWIERVLFKWEIYSLLLLTESSGYRRTLSFRRSKDALSQRLSVVLVCWTTPFVNSQIIVQGNEPVRLQVGLLLEWRSESCVRLILRLVAKPLLSHRGMRLRSILQRYWFSTGLVDYLVPGKSIIFHVILCPSLIT